MREIKIKFWDSLMNAWATDWLAINSGRLVADNEGKEFVDISDVDRFIPVQYTGLKDKNSKEIYEGDYIQNYGGLYVIEYNDGCFGYRQVAFQESRVGEPWVWKKENGRFKSWHKYVGPWEIIGNIYENLELLEAE